MLIQNGFFLTKNSSKKIKNSSSEALVKISNVHGKGMAPNCSHLSPPTITNENLTKNWKFRQWQQSPTR